MNATNTRDYGTALYPILRGYRCALTLPQPSIVSLLLCSARLERHHSLAIAESHAVLLLQHLHPLSFSWSSKRKMSLKRKASFTTLTSPRPSSSYNATVSPVPVCPGDVITIDETPRHLHSRTRKRFKNDRPDDQSLYGELHQPSRPRDRGPNF